MKIFISWSGERSLALAQALHGWLPLVLHYVDPWLSKSDIDAGQRWDDELSKTLNECNFGISCVTNDNLLAPWLLFEAGALAKSVDEGKLVPLLLGLDMKDLSGPLTRFQAKKTDKAGISEILTSINKASSTAIPDFRLNDLLDMAWDKLEEKIAAIPDAQLPVKAKRDQSEILEELVSGVRSVESRVRDMSDDDPMIYRKRRRMKMFPPMIDELVHMVGQGPDDPIQIIVISSFFRDDAPWLYEIGLLAYKAIREGNLAEGRQSLRAFQRGFEMMIHGPFGREVGIDREMMHMLMRDIEPFINGDFSERFLGKSRTIKRKMPDVDREAE
ncbi:MAG: toll/interleukin-1 receptor domain-containing protein [Novosphingobium sp.]